jgi:hypothetical protein
MAVRGGESPRRKAVNGMELHVNWIAILLATISTMIVGTVWYLPKVFGDRWMALTGVDPNKPKSRAAAYGGSFAASAVTAIVLASVADLVARGLVGGHGLGLVPAALIAASGLWLGFTATRSLVHYLFDQRSLKVWAIDSAYEQFTVLVMAVIIGLLGN